MIGPKEKKERALGVRLQLKAYRCMSPKCAMVRRPHRPGVHGKNRRRMPSDFGRQLQEKQKFKLTYGLNEKNLLSLFREAQKKRGSTAQKMLELFERRLDNTVFRAGLAPSRIVARQSVVHGHIQVNGRKVTAPGYQVKKGDVLRVRPESAENVGFKVAKEALKDREAPSWLHVDAAKLEAKVIALPEEVEAPFEVSLLVESFSK